MNIQLETAIYLLGIFLCFQLMFVLHKLKNPHLDTNRYIFLFLGLTSISLLDSACATEGLYNLEPHLILASAPIIFFYGPFYYFYILHMTKEYNKESVFKYHCVPFALSLLIYAPFFLSYTRQEKLEMIQGSMTWSTYEIFIVVGMTLLELLQIGIYLQLSRNQLKKYQQFLNDNYSNQSEVTLEWLKKLTNSLYVVFLLYFIDFLSFDIISLVQVVWIIFFTWLNFEFFNKNKMTITVEFPSKETNKNKENISEDTVVLFTRKVENEKIYLESDLTLSDLSEIFHMPRYRISDILKQGLNTTFYDYINRLRIEEAKRLLLDREHEGNILSVSLDSGFKSRSAFYNAFKKECGITPTEFKKLNSS